MYTTRKTRRPAFKTREQEERENRALDARLARQDAERQQRLDSMIAEHQASLTPAQAQHAAAELAKLHAKAADESSRQREWLDRRNAERLTSWTSGT